MLITDIFYIVLHLGLEYQASLAQEEMDAVIIGNDRLTEFQDRERLLNLEYVLQETLR